MSETLIEGILGSVVGIPVIEDEFVKEGTYICIDKEGLPIKKEDYGKNPISKILVHDFETFKMSINHNGGKL